MALLDALAGKQQARSVVELSLARTFAAPIAACMRRSASVLRLPNGTLPSREETLLQLIAVRLAWPPRRKFWLFGIDATSVPRVFAPTCATGGLCIAPTDRR